MKYFFATLLICIFMPTKSLAQGRFKVNPKMNLSTNTLGADFGLQVDEPLLMVHYDGYAGMESEPVPGPGYFYSGVTKQGLYLDLGKFRISPAYVFHYSFSQGFARHEMQVGLSYKLWE